MADILPRFKRRQAFTVPTTSGNYAPERLTFGAPPTPVAKDQFGNTLGSPVEVGLLGITFLLEATQIASCVAELWLPQLGTLSPSSSSGDGVAPTDSNYTYSGYSISSGALTVPLASFVGAQIRVKSGGSSGTQTVSATAD